MVESQSSSKNLNQYLILEMPEEVDEKVSCMFARVMRIHFSTMSGFAKV